MLLDAWRVSLHQRCVSGVFLLFLNRSKYGSIWKRFKSVQKMQSYNGAAFIISLIQHQRWCFSKHTHSLSGFWAGDEQRNCVCWWRVNAFQCLSVQTCAPALLRLKKNPDRIKRRTNHFSYLAVHHLWTFLLIFSWSIFNLYFVCKKDNLFIYG